MSEKPTPSLIHARGLTKRFGEFVAVDAIDFDVAPGELFGFLALIDEPAHCVGGPGRPDQAPVEDEVVAARQLGGPARAGIEQLAAVNRPGCLSTLARNRARRSWKSGASRS